MAEFSRIESLVAARYDDHLLSLSDAERSREEAAAEAANASGYQLSAEWSHRGVVRSLWSFGMRIPVASPLTATPRERASRFLDDHGGIFGLSSAGSALQVERTGPKDGGGTVVRLKEALRGLPIFGSGLVLHVGPEGDVEWLAGLVLPEAKVASAAATPALTADMAAATVGGTSAGSELGWFDQEAFGVPMGPARLAWRVRSAVGYEEYDVYVDAATGSELARIPLSDATISLDLETFYCDYCYPDELPGSIQYDTICHPYGEAQCPEGWCDHEWCWNHSGGEGTSPEIFLGTYWTYDYYLTRHDRDGWDDNQYPAYHRMRASSDTAHCPCNARWRPMDDPYAPAQTEFCSTMASLDVVGHEFTHGVDESEGDLAPGCTQSGALSEAISDVFGEFIQRYATGSTDWATMTDSSPECSDYSRSLKDPDGPANDKLYLCKCGSGTSTQIIQPDNWSNYRPECGSHYNSTVISKAGYLLGREPGEGSETHWGVAVTGIGEAKAGKVWYDTLVDDLSGAETFTTFRQAFLYECQHHTSGSDYINCFSSVRAVGLWSIDFAHWNTDATVDMARWTVGGEERRYIFYKHEGINTLYYRYRTCPFNISCSWSSESYLDPSSSGPSAAVLPGSYMVVCFRNPSGNGIWCDKWNPSGNITAGPDIQNVPINGEPTLVYFSNTLYIAYRKNTSDISWHKYNTATGAWGPEQTTSFQSNNPPVLVSSREDYWGPSDSCLWIVYTYDANKIKYRLFNTGSQTWGTERYAGQSDQTVVSMAQPGASFFRGRLHIAALYPGNAIYYLSCKMPCRSQNEDDWTRYVEQDPGAQGGLVLENYGAYDGYLYLWHRLASSNYLYRRDKLSQ